MRILNQRIESCKRKWPIISKLTTMVVVLLGLLVGGCHQMVPLAPDYTGYAPILASPLTKRAPGVGTSVGCIAPDFKLVDLSGQDIKLSDYRGNPVVLNFWTYCAACKEELPYIQIAYDERESLAPGLLVFAINVTQQRDQVEEFIRNYGYTFEILMDTWATVASDYYIHQIPTTFFLDKNGIIQDVQVGEFSGPAAIKQKIKLLARRE